jgi:hypothetical protein
MKIDIIEECSTFVSAGFVESKPTIWRPIKSYLYLLVVSDNKWTIGARYLNFGVEIDHNISRNYV